MKPQADDPCVKCAHWSNKTGCKMNRYNSMSMTIFGYCGFVKPKTKKDKE